MSKKTTIKKASNKPTVLPLTKKNALAFAKKLFSVSKNTVTFTPLCEGSLATKDGARTIHCAVGEAFHDFVNPKLSLMQEDTEVAIEKLIQVAQLRDRNEDTEAELRSALDECVGANDDALGGNPSATMDYLSRAERVSEIWTQEVVPLLK